MNWHDATRERGQWARQGRRGNPPACQPTASLLASTECAILYVAAAVIAASLPVAAAAEASAAPTVIGVCFVVSSAVPETKGGDSA